MNSKGQEVAREIIQQVEAEVPFNQAAAYAGIFLPAYRLASFGGDCTVLARELQARLRQAGYAPETIVERNHIEWHYAPICNVEGDLLHLDPMLFTQDPISISSVFETPGVPQSFPAFHSSTNNGQVVASSRDEGVFHLSKSLYEEPMHAYNLKTGRVALPTPEKALANALSIPRRSFNIIAVPSRSDVLHLRYNIGRRAIMLLRDGELAGPGHTDFERNLARLAENLGFEAGEFIEILDQSASLHDQFHSALALRKRQLMVPA